MDGMIVINKPVGMTSHDVVNILRKKLNTSKIGHSGTLDKSASGVLVLGVNKGTKILNYLNQDEKSYQFSICFGVTTDTLDHTGNITDRKPVQNLNNIESTLSSFMGVQMQTPPLYSAVKVKGKRLYQYAIKGEAPPRSPRTVVVHELRCAKKITCNEACCFGNFFVKASKGFYVRKLAEDLATKLNTVAHTTKIHRVSAGRFTIDHALDIEDVSIGQLISLNDALPDLKEHIVNQDECVRIENGARLDLPYQEKLIKCVDKTRKLLAIYEHRNDGYYAKHVLV